MIKNPLVSIIIPVYNCREYIQECVLSCINQDYKNIEIILVNDGSSDGTKEIIDNQFKDVSNIKIFHQLNSGPHMSRMKGVKESSGDFLFFLDSDDTIVSTCISFLISKQIEESLDIVCGVSMNDCFTIFSHDELLIVDNVVFGEYLVSGKFGGGLSIKLYDKKLFYSILGFKFDIRNNEDILVNLLLCRTNMKIGLFNEKLYYYRDTPYSLSKTYIDYSNYKKIIDILRSVDFSSDTMPLARKFEMLNLFKCFRYMSLKEFIIISKEYIFDSSYIGLFQRFSKLYFFSSSVCQKNILGIIKLILLKILFSCYDCYRTLKLRLHVLT